MGIAPDAGLAIAFWVVIGVVALIGVAAWGALILEEMYERSVGDKADRALPFEENGEASRTSVAGKPHPSAPLSDINDAVEGR